MSKEGTCACEAFAIGDLGPIADDEPLGRLIFSPEHIGQNGKVKVGAFPLSHIREKGLSLVRITKVSPELLHQFASALSQLGTATRTPAGYVAFETHVAREISLDDGFRAVCVWEDPTPETDKVPRNPAHANLVANRTINPEDALEIRTKLLFAENGRDLVVANSN